MTTLYEFNNQDKLDPAVPHAPRRPDVLNTDEKELALKNVLRYFPEHMHEELIPEFLDELKTYGHIYCYRFRPKEHPRAKPLSEYQAACSEAASIMLMIHNNLDPQVAQFPQELITYGGNGSVFSNWAQYRLTMQYLKEMTQDQTLVMYSGHPMGLFPSKPEAPRMIITNGMVIPNYSSKEMYEKMYALGVSQYGQMTAGSYCYIGPQGIVHGTMITILNAARKYCGVQNNDLGGLVYVTSGLGGMSGAQPKAAKICGCISVTAEVDRSALVKRHEQGWVDEMIEDVHECIARVKEAKTQKLAVSIGFLGNIVTLWEALAEEGESLIELGSDQTSLHNPYLGGYYPVDLSFDESRAMMSDNPQEFKCRVQATLVRHVNAINKLCDRGMKFWDYGNAFLVEAGRAHADIWKSKEKQLFKYPSYVQDIMGDIFSLDFGPFRWVCTSGDPTDLQITDQIAETLFVELMKTANPIARVQYEDNLKWIRDAHQNQMVVGSQARILYSNCEGRARLAQAFNEAVRTGRLSAPVVISRDHHDVSGTDSPYRETSNVYDGSAFTADMAIQNVIGDAARGATWVAIHNGGGVGWGEVINGGFGMVLDGTEVMDKCSESMLSWDVTNGVARRSWSGNENAKLTIMEEMERQPNLKVTVPYSVSPSFSIDGLATQYRLVLANCTVATMVDGYGLLENTTIAISKDGRIAYVGSDPIEKECADTWIDMEHHLVTPGLIDCHTHIVYQGERHDEWESGLNGVSYQTISEQGGEVCSTFKIYIILY